MLKNRKIEEFKDRTSVEDALGGSETHDET